MSIGSKMGAAVLMSVLVAGCTVRSLPVTPRGGILDIQSAVTRYVQEKYGWRLEQYRIETSEERTSEGYLIVDVICLEDEDERLAFPGAGKSFELFIDQRTGRIVREMGMQ